MNKLLAGLAIGCIGAAGVAWAGDPPAPKDAVAITLAAKAGEVFRFRQTDASSTEVDGKPMKAEESTYVYSATVRAAGQDGGLDVDLLFEEIHTRMLDRASGAWLEVDTSKPEPAGIGPRQKVMSAMMRALVGRPMVVSLDAHGTPVKVTGLREVVAAGLKGSPFETRLPVDKIFDDASVMKFGASLFVTSPPSPCAVGATWTGDTRESVSSKPLDYAVVWTLAAATAEDATVTSKLTWKPGADAAADGAKAAGTGEATATFSRKDGFVLSSKKHLEANRDMGASKSTSHNDLTIERLPAKAADTAKSGAASK